MKVCIAGRNRLAIDSLKYLIDTETFSKKDIVAIFSSHDLGQDDWQPSFKKYCINNKVRSISLEDSYGIRDMLFFSLQFDIIIKPNNFITKNLFNIHFSLLPAYKGMYPAIMPILRGERYSGVTLHLIDDGIDTGPIIDQIRLPIEISDTSRDLYLKYLINGLQLFTKNFNSLYQGNYTATDQPNVGSSYFSKSSINFCNFKIDLNKTSFEIHNQIRAFIFKEYQLPSINGCFIQRSLLTNDIIGRKRLIESENEIILSGIDGFKIVLSKHH